MVKFDRSFQHFAVTFRIMPATEEAVQHIYEPQDAQHAQNSQMFTEIDLAFARKSQNTTDTCIHNTLTLKLYYYSRSTKYNKSYLPFNYDVC